MRQFITLNVNDRKLSQIQDALANAINPLLALPLSDSNLLQDVSLSPGLNSINHGLQRKLIGWFVTRIRSDQNIWDAQDSNLTPALTLDLMAKDAAIIDLIVF